MSELTDSRAASFDLQRVVSELAAVRQSWREAQQRSTEPGGRELPSREALADIVKGLRGALFPMRLGPSDLRQESEDFYVGYTLDSVLHGLLHQVRLELSYASRHDATQTEAALDVQALHIWTMAEIGTIMASGIARDIANLKAEIKMPATVVKVAATGGSGFEDWENDIDLNEPDTMPKMFNTKAAESLRKREKA